MKGHFQFVAALLCCVVFSTPALAAGQPVKAQPSSARVTLKLQGSGEARSFDGLSSAFHELYEQFGAVGFYDTKVLDYSTFGSKQEQLVAAERAYFLVGASKAKGTGGEFKVVAFASRAAASKAQQKLGGELRDFEAAWAAVAEHWGVDLDGADASPAADPAPHRGQPSPARQREASADCFT